MSYETKINTLLFILGFSLLALFYVLLPSCLTLRTKGTVIRFNNRAIITVGKDNYSCKFVEGTEAHPQCSFDLQRNGVLYKCVIDLNKADNFNVVTNCTAVINLKELP